MEPIRIAEPETQTDGRGGYMEHAFSVEPGERGFAKLSTCVFIGEHKKYLCEILASRTVLISPLRPGLGLCCNLMSSRYAQVSTVNK